MNRIICLGFFVLLFSLMGCKDDPNEEPVNVAIEKEFKILLWETLEPNSRKFNLNIETIQSKSCENTFINVATSAVGSNVSMNIYDLPQPDCPAPIFTATANFKVGNLDIEDYDIIISLQNVVENRGTLKVAEDYYEIKMKDLDGIIIPENRLYKIPENTIWGYTAFDNDDLSSVADEFIDAIKGVTEERNYNSGYYGYFTMENNEMTIHEKINQTNTQSFGLTYQNDNSDLENILSDYRTANPDMEFKIFTSKGEEL